jgi:transaldolase/glucose-6-phosphate isomerase
VVAANNPIAELRKLGQSLWLDNIRRQLITSGELARLRDEGVTGITSNPTIFQKAVSGSTDYDEALVRLAENGHGSEDVLWRLMLEDIQSAADVLRPVYDQTAGADGFVSIEVSPKVADDTEGTVAMARDLFARADRPNVMVKIPATEAGIPAIRKALGEGININVTLIFATERYDQVVDAFLSGLEDLKARGGDVSKMASVASFFVSRVDSKVDKILDAKIEQTKDGAERERLRRLVGKAGIANSREAYAHWKRLHSGPRWEALAGAGARVQRCLWASTSTKDPRFPDTMYVEELIGPDTIDTVPPATLAAFREHGEVRRSLDENLDGARAQLRELAEVGVDLADVTRQLEVEGVEAFLKSFESLASTLDEAMKAIREGKGPRQWHSLGTLQPLVDDTVSRLAKEEVGRRLWAKDPALWPHADHPDRWLGWLTVPEKMLEHADLLAERAEAATEYKDVVLLGMGGSSLGPDVLRTVFGPVKGHPELHVLDTTDPATLLGLTERIDPATTLVIAASKSGSTTETRAHLEYFWDLARARGVEKPERNFAVITDPGSPLEQLAAERDYRWIFQNPTDIGGRYSVLSYFGMVPGAAMGADVRELLERAQEMASSCDASVAVENDPGVWLGAVLGSLAARGRDKVTLVMSPHVSTFGYWIEQLIAESTGKEGKGMLPVEGEPLGAPGVYGDDRVFVYTRMESDPENASVKALEDAGQPVVTLTLRDTLDLGGEFLRWEIAIAIAGAVIGIDPFTQPNVQESKDNTNRVLRDYTEKGALLEAETLAPAAAGPALAEAVRAAARGGYFTVMAYTERTDASEAAIERLRTDVRAATWLATTAGYGPRFLHSTGQYHKGGPPTGVYLQIVQEDARDAEIPGAGHGFSVLKQAQALGDLEALRSRSRPVVRVGLGRDVDAGWRELADAVQRALAE